MYRRYGKRCVDLCMTLPLMLILAPLMGILIVLVRCKLGTPVFFRQQRSGLAGKPFTILKFRTMTDACDAQGKLLPDVERLTPFGRFLRSTSLDELPGLINVLRGEMSLVGPRPLLMKYLDLYTPEQMRRHATRPGITGWAQIHGRNIISWEQKFLLDVWYVDHVSLWLDIAILAITIQKLIQREGISHPGHATMHDFTGSS